EVLRYYGITHSQVELKGILRPSNPYGMLTDPIAPYINSIGFKAVVSPKGTDTFLKKLIRGGFPVIVEDLVSASEPHLHYRALEGYDDQKGIFIAADTLLGPRHAIGYAEFDQIWKSTQNEFVIIYPPSRQQALDAAVK
ncbi:MAG TPA: hypothetical protein VKU60_18340, partial [Chloroflexota bacterium]|nr:hypothetical protein [Chloroflexota bacterium]